VPPLLSSLQPPSTPATTCPVSVTPPEAGGDDGAAEVGGAAEGDGETTEGEDVGEGEGEGVADGDDEPHPASTNVRRRRRAERVPISSQTGDGVGRLLESPALCARSHQPRTWSCPSSVQWQFCNGPTERRISGDQPSRKPQPCRAAPP
jgi:hypothetical protein